MPLLACEMKRVAWSPANVECDTPAVALCVLKRMYVACSRGAISVLDDGSDDVVGIGGEFDAMDARKRTRGSLPAAAAVAAIARVVAYIQSPVMLRFFHSVR